MQSALDNFLFNSMESTKPESPDSAEVEESLIKLR